MSDGVEEYNHIWIGDAVLVALLVGAFIIGCIIYAIVKDGHIVSFEDAFDASLVYFLIGGAVWFVITGMYVTLDFYGDTGANHSLLMFLIYGVILFLLICGLIVLAILICIVLAVIMAVPIYLSKNWRRWKAARAVKKAKNASRIECLETKIHSLQEEVVSLRGKEEADSSFPDVNIKSQSRLEVIDRELGIPTPDTE